MKRDNGFAATQRAPEPPQPTPACGSKMSEADSLVLASVSSVSSAARNSTAC